MDKDFANCTSLYGNGPFPCGQLTRIYCRLQHADTILEETIDTRIFVSKQNILETKYPVTPGESVIFIPSSTRAFPCIVETGANGESLRTN